MGMREPFVSEALEIDVVATDSVKRDPSYPDRARIDSDVRAFLRPVSTPWIVFDRDSRVDDFAKSALRAGAFFASSPSFRSETLEEARRGASAPSGASEEVTVDTSALDVVPSVAVPVAVPAAEPSDVALSRDLPSEFALEVGRGTPPSNPFARAVGWRSPRRALGLAALVAAAAAVAATALGVSSFGGAPQQASARSAALAVGRAAPANVAEMPPSPAGSVALDPAADRLESAPPRRSERASASRKRLGKLSIRADAKSRNVWLDGKRMLGAGPRSFLVACGMHTIAVADRSDARDVEIPCDGEYSVGK